MSDAIAATGATGAPSTCAALRCPTCGGALAHPELGAPPIALGARVEVETMAGVRLGWFVGYEADGRATVTIDGTSYVHAADRVKPLAVAAPRALALEVP